MLNRFSLSEQHLNLLDPLTKKVRVLSFPQIERTLFSGTSDAKESAKALTEQLEQAGYLVTYSAMVHPEIKLSGAICCYEPNGTVPDFKAVASVTRGRWKQSPVVTRVAYATKHAKQELGGYLGGKKPRPSETRHDIHVAQIYLNMQATDPARAVAWMHEEQLRDRPEFAGGSRPDALVASDEPVVIEFGGAYPRKKLEAFHAQQQQRRYEIW